MPSFSVYKPSSATCTTARIRTTTSQDSQLGTADQQQPRCSFMGLLTTPLTPAESSQISSTYYQQDELRLLSDISASQTNRFEALATHQTVTFDDQAVTTGFAGAPNLLSDQCQAEQSPDPTVEWIIVNKLQEKPYIFGYPEGLIRIT